MLFMYMKTVWPLNSLRMCSSVINHTQSIDSFFLTSSNSNRFVRVWQLATFVSLPIEGCVPPLRFERSSGSVASRDDDDYDKNFSRLFIHLDCEVLLNGSYVWVLPCVVDTSYRIGPLRISKCYVPNYIKPYETILFICRK